MHRRANPIRLLKVRQRVRVAFFDVWAEWTRQGKLSRSLGALSLDLELSPDARQAYVRFSSVESLVFGTQNPVEEFERIKKPLRYQVARRAQLKYAPDLVFHPAKQR